MDQEALFRGAAEDTLRRESEARRFLYSDVVELIQVGFLTQPFSLGGSRLALRSLGSVEIRDLILRASHCTETEWMRHHIAASVHMINGYSVEPQYGSNQAWHIYNEWTQNLHYEQVLVVYSYVMSLRKRIERAIKITDAYCHERFSRSQWRMTGPAAGSRNTIQQLWTAFNETEDQFDADIRQWQHTRSIVGSMSAKGSKSLKEAEDKWNQKREDRGRRLIEEAVNWVISGDPEDQEPVVVTIDGQTYEVPTVHAAQTVAEMESEMMRAVRGEKDYHDTLVDRYKESHRRRLEASRRQRREAMEAAWGGQEEGLRGETRMVGYTPEQLAKINPALLTQAPNTQRSEASPERDRFNQYLDTEVAVGWIGLQGTPESAAPTPKKTGGGGSLQDKINRRTPTLKQ